jgi:hypothetical protein
MEKCIVIVSKLQFGLWMLIGFPFCLFVLNPWYIEEGTWQQLIFTPAWFLWIPVGIPMHYFTFPERTPYARIVIDMCCQMWFFIVTTDPEMYVITADYYVAFYVAGLLHCMSFFD